MMGLRLSIDTALLCLMIRDLVIEIDNQHTEVHHHSHESLLDFGARLARKLASKPAQFGSKAK